MIIIIININIIYVYIIIIKKRVTQLLSSIRGAANHFRERQPEFGTEHGVDNWVQGGIEVTQPQEETGHVLVDEATVAQGHDQGHNEERQPAYHERSGDDGEGLGCLTFSFRFQRLFFLALRLDPSCRRHGRHVHSVHVHLNERMPGSRRRFVDGGPVVLDHRR